MRRLAFPRSVSLVQPVSGGHHSITLHSERLVCTGHRGLRYRHRGGVALPYQTAVRAYPMSHGQSFVFDCTGLPPTSTHVARIVLVAPGSVTHHCDMHQRYLELSSDVQSGNTEFARTMAWLGPLPGSPYPALVFDEPGYFNFIDWGRIGLVRGSQPGAHLQHDTGCSSSGTVPTNVLRWGPLGLRLAVAKAPPGALAFLVVGTSISNHLGVALPLSLDPIGWPGCRLNVAPEFVAGHLLSTGVHGGYAAHDFAAVPVATGGYRLFAQWLVADANEHAATPVQEFQVR
jgi:hypothetical protein